MMIPQWIKALVMQQVIPPAGTCLKCFFIKIKAIVTEDDYQPGNQDHIKRQPDHQAQDDHADADRPDRLQADDRIMSIKTESKTNDEYFNEQEPQPSFNKKNT